MHWKTETIWTSRAASAIIFWGLGWHSKIGARQNAAKSSARLDAWSYLSVGWAVFKGWQRKRLTVSTPNVLSMA